MQNAPQVKGMKIFEGCYIPDKLLQYASREFGGDPQLLRRVLNLYKNFAKRVDPISGQVDHNKIMKENMELMEKWINVYVSNFREDDVRRVLDMDPAEAEGFLLDEIERNLQGTVLSIRKADAFRYFKPMIHGFLDPANILYTLATRRPSVYNIIAEHEGGFDWVKRMVRKVKLRYGMAWEIKTKAGIRIETDPLMVELYEIKAILPSTKDLQEQE